MPVDDGSSRKSSKQREREGILGTRRMKIALFENLTSGGSKREAHEFVRQFVRAGHAVDRFHPSTADESFVSFGDMVRCQHNYALRLAPDLPLRLPGLTRYFALSATFINLGRLKRLAKEVAGEIDAGGYDFAFVHHDRIVQSPYLLRYLKTPSVYFCNEPMREFYDPPVTPPYQQPRSLLDRAQRGWYAPARGVDRFARRSADRRNVRRAGLLLANSYFSAESIYRAYGLRARVVYLGIDVEKFRPADVPREDFVLSVGAVSPLKGYDFLIDALAAVPEELRPRIVLVGNTASAGEKRRLEQLAADRNVRLEICVDLSDEQLADLYRRALLFVYAPILEPFGLAPVEAMGCGTAVVAVKEGGVRESVGDGETGLLVERRPEAFAQAVCRLLRDEPLRRRMGAAGRRRAIGFWTWEHAWERLHRALSDYLADSKILCS